MKTLLYLRYLMRTLNSVTVPLILTLIFWAEISGYQLPPGTTLDLSGIIPDFSFLQRKGFLSPDNYGAIYRSSSKVTDPTLHGVAGWEGVDVSAGCGETIYSPIDGRITYNGLDKYDTPQGQATMLTITGDGIEVTLLHGDYLTAVGERVKAGQAVGKENKHGWASGCHSHVIVRVNNRTVNYLNWLQEHSSKMKLARRSGGVAEYGMRQSHYDTSFCYDANGNVIKNTNCDSDPTTMASGEKVADWIGGQNGVFAAACPNRPDLGWVIGNKSKGIVGTRFNISGVEAVCKDTGGWIQCYESGDFDPAIANAHAGGYLLDQPEIAEQAYCWSDLMIDIGIAPYGTLTFDWSKD